jgi:hypothetical protein
MNPLRTLCLLVMLTLAARAFPQAGTKPGALSPSPTPQVQQSPQPAPSIASVLERQISAMEKQVVEAAEAMPDSKFGFTPESLNIPGSDYKGVRSFALEVRHIATINYVFWSPLTGDPVPAGIKGPNGPEELKTKAEIIKFLKDSYALGRKAAATLNAENVVELVPFRDAQAPRLHLANLGVIHANDHYGQIVEYLRMNGIVPPVTKEKWSFSSQGLYTRGGK